MDKDMKQEDSANKAEKEDVKTANTAETANATETTEEKAQEENPEEKLQKELDEQKDKYLRLAAEFDNFRRRVAKEKLELIGSASEEVIKALLPIIDDFERALEVLAKSKDADSAKEGTELIYKKLCDLLKSKGVEEIKAIGLELNTDEHEAVAQIPALDKGQKGKITDVAQKGYKMGGMVIRFAKVVVAV